MLIHASYTYYSTTSLDPPVLVEDHMDPSSTHWVVDEKSLTDRGPFSWSMLVRGGGSLLPVAPHHDWSFSFWAAYI